MYSTFHTHAVDSRYIHHVMRRLFLQSREYRQVDMEEPFSLCNCLSQLFYVKTETLKISFSQICFEIKTSSKSAERIIDARPC